MVGCDKFATVDNPDTYDNPNELRPLVDQAKSGVAFAQFQLGTMYEHGEVVASTPVLEQA